MKRKLIIMITIAAILLPALQCTVTRFPYRQFETVLPPEVISIISPFDNTTSAAIDSSFILQFSEILNDTVKGSISFSSPAVSFDTNNSIISFSTTQYANDTITINPFLTLPLLTDYNGITISGFQDHDNIIMQQSTITDYNFKTSNATGIYDPTFNTADPTIDFPGYLTYNNNVFNDGDTGRSVLVYNGIIYVAGHTWRDTSDLTIWSFNEDGTFNTAFDGDGILYHHNAAGGDDSDEAFDMLIDQSGRIVCTGESTGPSGTQDMAIWRITTAGALDTTFNGSGYVSHHAAAGANRGDGGNGIAIDNSNCIVVAGSSYQSSVNEDMTVWRYTEDGTLDLTLNGSGFNTYNATNSDMGYAVTIDAQNRIYVCGHSGQAMAIWRYTALGLLDTSFNSPDGFVTRSGDAGSANEDCGMDIAIDTQNRIVVTGYGESNDNTDMITWRFLENGSIDTSFNGTGFVVHNNAAGGNTEDKGMTLTFDAENNILVGGNSYNKNFMTDAVIWRIKENGTFDTSFNGCGYATYTGFVQRFKDHEITSLTVDSKHRIIATGFGYHEVNSDDLILLRLQ